MEGKQVSLSNNGSEKVRVCLWPEAEDVLVLERVEYTMHTDDDKTVIQLSGFQKRSPTVSYYDKVELWLE